MLLGFYKNADSHAMALTRMQYMLPVVAVPRFIVDKIESLGYDYKRVIDSTINMPIDMGGVDDDESPLKKDITDVIGYTDTRVLYLINRHMMSNCMNCVEQVPMHEFKVGNYYNEVDRSRSEMLDIIDMMDTPSDKCEYEFSVSGNSVFIIMNDSFFSEPDKVYRKMSRDLCEYMLDFIDERLIFQSVFYKVIAFTE